MDELRVPFLYAVAIINVVLAVIIFSRGVKNAYNITFGLMSLAVASWCVAIVRYYSETSISAGQWLAWTHSLALFIAVVFLYFSSIFPRRIIKRSSLIYLASAALLIITIYAIFNSNFIVGKSYGVAYEINSGYKYYAILIFSYFIAGYFLLYRQLILSRNNLEHDQVLYVFVGAIISSVLALITDLILPYLGIFELTWLGPIFTLILVFSIFLAILRYRLFNIRVITAELFSFILVSILAIELFFAKSIQDLSIRSIILLLVVIFIFFFIRGVYKEVEQRERIEKLAQDLSEANKRQENLMHIMNHQIKDYLGTSRSIFAELLSGDYGAMPESAKPFLKQGFDKLTRGVEYVQGILRGASAASGKLPYDMRPIDLREVAAPVIAEGKRLAEEKGLSFKSFIGEGDYSITGDAVQIAEAFKNLISNAIKYNSPRGSIDVSLRREGGKIIYTVADTGLGVSAEDLPRLFTLGGMGKNSIKINTEAAGFGLSFVKSVAEAHKGRAGYKPNKLGKGSVFFMEF
jgi:signal transduction histidine kinase